MSATPKTTISTAVPCLCYRDAHAAIDWLCEVFGFAQHLVVEGENGTAAHARAWGLTIRGKRLVRFM